ncbi:hypothetical protein BGZ61DRAFT_361986 [Ilyonectria robusta]|uniref:uncharacterized protein n=1 Tax=Ilyonectria robusta TaxID=1079257 RepID=UPI001E8D48DC|nr:uncharacterized protein BGZ61DRAFT_361986 [Ilyonectria robusta]KAH6986269.1 hypothetical protein BKA56DRAFT_580139 [Ilyonectria sp. MPI-CAGE-AT-0026]KAH8673048.1 hypothetical protein BGZ61DRAFT_361986 [Ilyonectria robusta]
MSRLLAPNLRALLRPSAPSAIRLASGFGSRPAPPKLPASEQAEFERLQRAAAVSSAFQPEADAASPDATAAASAPEVTDVNPGLFRGAPPEFEGDVNPKTGEVGGPKNEPLRWGDKGDWSYNGRVTDF